MTVNSRIEESIAGPRDYWGEAGRGLQADESLDGLLPAFRALPDCPEAAALVLEGRAAWRYLLEIARKESGATIAFKNALFLFMYFDNLFVYRELKSLYAKASPEQRPFLDVACRKIILRCLETPEGAHGPLTREIVRNTWRGRLATTPMVIEMANNLFGQWHRPIVIKDMAVSDGVTTLDLAEEAARRGVEAAITGSDLRLYLIYAETGGNGVVCYSNGEVCQCEIGGETYGAGRRDVPADLEEIKSELVKSMKEGGAERITLLAPQVDYAARTGQYPISFKEEDAFDPRSDIGEADIIRIANLLVERSDNHAGYYYRSDILKAMSRLGVMAKDGAYLYLDNFIKKVEHIGLWRKDVTVGEWTRMRVKEAVAEDLAGVSNIPIG